MKAHAIRLLLRCYPARWRRRYGAEFTDLLTTRTLTLRITIDVILGALDAQRQANESLLTARRWSLVRWWALTHLILGAATFAAIRMATGQPRDLFAIILVTLLLGSAGQWLILRQHLDRVVGWVPATMAGALLGLVLIVGIQSTRWYRGGAVADLLLFAMLGLTIGVAQWCRLRRYGPAARWWVCASLLGGGGIVPAYMLTLILLRATWSPIWRTILIDIYSAGTFLLLGSSMALIYALATSLALLQLCRSQNIDQQVSRPVLDF